MGNDTEHRPEATEASSGNADDMKKNKSKKTIKEEMHSINFSILWHWCRNNGSYTNYFYYRLSGELEKNIREIEKHGNCPEELECLRQDLRSSKQSFDRLYGIAKFMESEEFYSLSEGNSTVSNHNKNLQSCLDVYQE